MYFTACWVDNSNEVFDLASCFFVFSFLFIGYGPSAISEPFETLYPGYPGSPSHVVARNLTHDSAVVCWLESSFGRPFLSYSVEITESSSNQTVKIQRFDSSQVGRVQDCDTGTVVSHNN